MKKRLAASSFVVAQLAWLRGRGPRPRVPGGAVPALFVLLAACSGGGGGGVAGSQPGDTVHAELQRVEFGRLVDVYGLQADGTPLLHRQDVVVGAGIEDQRPNGSTLADGEVTYDFVGFDPDTLQPKLLIPRVLDSAAFRDAFAALDDTLREVAPTAFGRTGGLPCPVVPRNAAIRLTFSAPLGIDDTFFVTRDAAGRVNGLRNTEAVQLLQIVGDPEQPAGCVPLPVRVAVHERTLVLDPVLLGSEGLQYQTVNNAAGLPASPDAVGANIRIALALAGPLALPRLAPEAHGLRGRDNSGRDAVVRDFRSGNAADSSFDLARGFARDPLPLRLLGELPMYLEAVETVNSTTQEVTVWKHGIVHEIDRGDVLRFVADASGVPIGRAEVVVDPEDDRGAPATQHVRVRIRRLDGLAALDPRQQPGYPADLAQREAWLLTHAPRAVLVAEFTAGDAAGRDDPRHFLAFSPTPLALGGVPPAPNEFVSPFAAAIVRFSKPVDLATVRWADTFFFAMRDLVTDGSRAEFVASRPNNLGGTGMNAAAFDEAKYRTPYLITSRVHDEDGSQTTLRLQPTAGFFLDQTMRNAPPGVDLRYFLHLVSQSGDGGIRDLAGNPLDLQGETAERSGGVVIPFTVDTRSEGGAPLFADNLAISVVRRFASRDEDANPSYFLAGEVQAPGSGAIAAGYPLEDLFGGFVQVDGALQARPSTRSRLVVDNLNQSPVVQQPALPAAQAPLGWCPQSVLGQATVAANTANSVLNQGIQNPLNPYGARLQMCWREVDLSLSRTDPFAFDLDIEQMYWAPYTGTSLTYDEFDRTSLTLGHAEFRPAPCVGAAGALAVLPNSGLRTEFERNFLCNGAPVGNGSAVQSQAPRRAAYVDRALTIDPASVVLEPNGVNRFLPLPGFQKPYFVFRDQTVVEQGGNLGLGADNGDGTLWPYVVSPFAMGQGRHWVDRGGAPGNVAFVSSYWNDLQNQPLGAGTDAYTGGLVGSVACPLLADFWTYCDSSELPTGHGYVALGLNGWQVAITVQSGPTPNFRVQSAGQPAVGGQPAQCVQVGQVAWNVAQGAPGAFAGDNSLYWIMLDVVKRQSVITNGFLDLNDPHRVPEGFADPRLGPFFLNAGVSTVPNDVLPTFAYEFDPPLSRLPAGTSLVPQFRGASVVDANPWYWQAWMQNANGLFPAPGANNQPPGFDAAMRAQLRPTASNFPLDPYKAGDAHLRKWDTRTIPGSGTVRNWWTHLYNRTVTQYVNDPNQLLDAAYCQQFQGPNEVFTPHSIRYVNWRFVTSNNVDASPPVAPTIETFALSYRFQRRP